MTEPHLEPYNRGKNDAYQDRCENVPFASTGGIEARQNMVVPNYIPDAERALYLEGYRFRCEEMFGEDWATCEFGWNAALTIDNGGAESAAKSPELTDEELLTNAETMRHILTVRTLLAECASTLITRGTEHDRSKLADPEAVMFNEFTRKLAKSEYGSDEYKGFLKEMGPALEHHYRFNAHHPEHVDRDIEWRPVVGFEETYEVSNMGDVRSVTREVDVGGRFKRKVPGQPMTAHLNAFGYPRMQLAAGGGKRKNVFVHVLVAGAFVLNSDSKPEVNHKNGNKIDNRAANLEWATRCENNQHAHDTGLNPSPAKWVIICPEQDLVTLGANEMERQLRQRGIETFSSGIWRAATKGGEHKGLAFESKLLAEHRRSQMLGMNLFDLLEMLVDWKAATLRHETGDIHRSLELNAKRFEMPDALVRLLANTIPVLEELAERSNAGASYPHVADGA